MKYKPGMVLKSKTSNVVITLVSRASGNRHWNSKKERSKNSHKIHEGTLDKFYAPLEKKRGEV